MQYWAALVVGDYFVCDWKQRHDDQYRIYAGIDYHFEFDVLDQQPDIEISDSYLNNNLITSNFERISELDDSVIRSISSDESRLFWITSYRKLCILQGLFS